MPLGVKPPILGVRLPAAALGGPYIRGMEDTEREPDACPRCGGTFRCGANDAAPCACTGLTLPPATLAALQARWRGCLCLRCLQALAAGAPLRG